MTRKDRITPPEPAAIIEAAAPEPVVEEAETDAEIIDIVEKAVEITSDDILAIRRLRQNLIEKLFTPDRSFNSWTELKANN